MTPKTERRVNAHWPIVMEMSSHFWGLDGEQLNAMLSALDGELTAEATPLFHAACKPSIEGELAQSHYTRRIGSVGVIDVFGPLIPRGTAFTDVSGIVSTSVLSAEFRELASDPSVESIVVALDSPGGAVTGISEFAAEIRTCAKPVVSFVVGNACSSAYWIASAAQRVVAADTAMLGSIGAILTIQPRQDAKTIEIVSSQSPNKLVDAKTEAGRKHLQDRVDDVASVFIGAVAAHRGVSEKVVVSKFGQGGTMIARKALAAGMIDGIGTFAGLLKSLQSKSFDLSQTTPAPAFCAEVTERNPMNLKEVLAAYPGIRDEIAALEADAAAKAVDAAVQPLRARIDAASIVLSAHYPDELKALAIGVLKGEDTPDLLRGMVKMHDVTKARMAVTAAAETSASVGPTPPQQHAAPSTDGVLRTHDDVAREIEKFKKGGY